MKTRVGLVFLLGIAACPVAVPTAFAQKVRVGYVHVFDDAPVVVARDKGFFTAEGLEPSGSTANTLARAALWRIPPDN